MMQDEAFKTNYNGFDIWTEHRPDTIDERADVLELPLDRNQDFMIMPPKCFKKCDIDGICQFNAHFQRKFETGDKYKDYQLDENVDKTFYVLGYYETYKLNNRSETKSKGLGDDITIKMGRIKDYELSQAASLGSLAGASVALLSLLLLG